MGAHKTAKLFTHGGSQAVRLPKEFRFDGSEVRIRKEGDKVILEPTARDMAAFWAELDRLQAEAGEPLAYPPYDPPTPPPKAGF
jgi:antitoxin VapB